MNRIVADSQGSLLRTGLSAALIGLTLLSSAGRTSAEDAAVSIDEPLASTKGTLFICGGGRMPDPVLNRFVDLAGGELAHLVVITTASETADTGDVEIRIDFWKRTRLAEMTVLHTRSRVTADDPQFCKPLTTATGVWFIGGHQNRLTEAYRGTRVEQEIRGVLERGGVVGGTSAGAAVMSPVMIRGGNPQAEIEAGFGFLPGTVVDQHFLKRRRQDRLLNVLSAHPRLVGIGIDEGTAVVVQGRQMSVVSGSESNVVTCLAAVDGKPERTIPLEPGAEADLVALRRAALTRMQPRFRFDDDQPEARVSEGTLILVGGGETPPEAARQFIEAAGGPDANFVVISTAVGDLPPPEAEVTGWLKAAGARHVRRVHPRNPREAEEPAVLEALSQAGGVWFCGGRQWRLVDALNDTAAERLVQEVLKRGGTVGGSAAGASILAAYLVRGNPLTNRQMMAAGYEEGFGLLPGAAIDPYFTQRTRLADMTELKKAYPQLVGLGIDEGAAIVVKGHEFEVLGKNRVSVFARLEPPADGERDYDILAAGDRYDLHERKVVSVERSFSETAEVAERQENEEAIAALPEATDAADPQPQPALVCE